MAETALAQTDMGQEARGKRLRVTFVSRKWPPAMGGIETYSARLAHALKSDADLDLMVLPGQPDGSVPGPGALIGFGLRTALRLLTNPRPGEITHVTDMASWPLALAAWLRAPGSTIILSAHGTDVSYGRNATLRGRLYAAYMWLAARALPRTRVIANSRATADLARRYGFRHVDRVRLAADLPDIPVPPTPERFVLFSGRLMRGKGCGWFIREVLPRLPEDITLHVAGTIWHEDEGALLDHPRVRHLGKLDLGTLTAAYARALCVVVPNVDTGPNPFEGFGLVASEAAVAGGVVLAADFAGIPDALDDGETGFLLAPCDADAWTAQIAEVAGWSTARRAAYTAQTRARARALFTWERVADETRALYRGPGTAP